MKSKSSSPGAPVPAGHPKTEEIVNFFANSFAEVEDVRGTLLWYLPGEDGLVDHLLARFAALSRSDPARYRAALLAEPGDVTLRGWIAEAVAEYRNA